MLFREVIHRFRKVGGLIAVPFFGLWFLGLWFLLGLAINSGLALNLQGADESQPTLKALSDDRLRTAIERGIPLLEKGSAGSADQRECFTCHSQAVPVFALAEASRRGFKVDQANLDRQIQHTINHLRRGLENYKKGVGQGGNVLTAGYALWALEEARHEKNEVTEAVSHYLLEFQKDQEQWTHHSGRPPTSDSDFTATYVALRAISFFHTPDQETRWLEKQTKVRQWLQSAAEKDVAKDQEDRVFQLGTLHYADAPAEQLAAAIESLKAKQLADGGWEQVDGMGSDAYATATGLYALITYGHLSRDDQACQRAASYLIEHQLPDGSWHVKTRAKGFQTYFESGFPHGKDQFISIAASAWATWSLMLMLPPPATVEPIYDCVIRGGLVVDGTGEKPRVADVAIHQGKIVKVGEIERGLEKTTIDATGLCVAPGFVDMMGQSATPMLRDPNSAMNLLTQGITTINAGEGASAAPLPSDPYLRAGWTNMHEYFALLEMQGLPINVAQSVGHTQVRMQVLGEIDRRPSDAELDEMRRLVRESMQAGAVGLSTALIYPPAVYAPTEEIIALAEESGKYGGRYYTHMRNEGDRLLEAIDEALEIGRSAKVPVHIFHLKTAGIGNWPKMPLAIEKIRTARQAGIEVAADIYPYINNGLEIGALIHPRHFQKGDAALREQLDDPSLRKTIREEMESGEGWENWYAHVGKDWDKVIVGQTSESRYSDALGQSIAQIAKMHQEDPWDTFFALVKKGAFVLPQSMSEENKILAMQQDFVSFCTDVGPASKAFSAAHPRAAGSFPKLLARYVREQKALSIEQFVHQASRVAALELGAKNRGLIQEGFEADVVVWDQQSIVDRATFSQPLELSQGIKHVLVNGVVVLEDGKYSGNKPGKVLRGAGYDPKTAPAVVRRGEASESFGPFDQILQQFMREQSIVGMSAAVSVDGKMVYSQGYGYADLQSGEQVTPQSLFRIASISKPITAVAIMQLIEQEKLRLDSKVFEVMQYQGYAEEAKEQFDVRWKDVTIEHLLQHRGGWDRDQSFDAQFQAVRFARLLDRPSPANSEDVIRAMFRQKFDFAPGERYAYSNFGYNLLGRVIEKVSGVGYEQYVKEHILTPIGATSMRLGRSRLADRAAGEVRYYHPELGKSVFEEDLGQDVPQTYGAWNIEAMDSHGGWLASAEDLLRFADALDNLDHSPLLSRKSLESLGARPEGLSGYEADGKPKDSYYGLGWLCRPVGGGKVNYWHTGSLPGTATLLIRRHDGKNFVALVNSRQSPTLSHLGRALDPVMHRAVDSSLPRK